MSSDPGVGEAGEVEWTLGEGVAEGEVRVALVAHPEALDLIVLGQGLVDVGGLLHLVEVDLEADCRPVGLVELGQLVEARVRRAVVVDGQAGARRLAVGAVGVVDVVLVELDGLGGVVGRPRLGGGLVVEGAVGAEELGLRWRHPGAAEHVDEPVLVEGQCHGPADPHVVIGRLGGVDDVAAAVVAEMLVTIHALEVAGGHHGALAEALEGVDVARGQAVPTGVLVGDGPERDPVEVGEAVLPVVVVALHHQGAVSLPAHELEGSGAHPVGAGVFAGLLGGGGREGPARGVGKEVGEGGVGFGEVVGDGEVVDDLHRLHDGQGGGLVGGLDGEVVVEDGLERFGVERGVVVEHHVGTQGEGPDGEVVVGFDRLGQVRGGPPVGRALHERVVDGVGHVDARVGEVSRAGQPAVGLGFQTHRDGATLDRLALLGDVDLGAGVLRFVDGPGTAVAVAVVVVAAAGGQDQGRGEQWYQEPVTSLATSKAIGAWWRQGGAHVAPGIRRTQEAPRNGAGQGILREMRGWRPCQDPPAPPAASPVGSRSK